MTRDRLPPLATDDLSDAQKAAVEDYRALRGGEVFGPFVPLLRSPELMSHVQRLGEYLRFRSRLGHRLTEFALLMISRAWTQQVEWSIHAPIAIAAGVPPEVVEAIGEARRPADMDPDLALVHDFSAELIGSKKVSDATWARTVGRFGEAATVDLMGTLGYYSLLAMVMNGARTPAPEGSDARLRELEQH